MTTHSTPTFAVVLLPVLLITAHAASYTKNENNRFPFPKDCGEQTVDNKIIYGELAHIDEYPWMALLKYTTPAGSGYGCGGSLINDKYVLTAAHCVTNDKFGPPVEITLGEYNVETAEDCVDDSNFEICSDPPQFIKIEEIIVHPEYVKSSPQKLHDIALIRLKTVPTPNDFVKAICVPTEANRQKAFKFSMKFNVAGWGTTKHESASKIKRKAIVPFVDNETCSMNRTYKIAASQMCAGGGRQDTCHGDSGGPLMGICSDETETIVKHYLIGIISFGTRTCAIGKPSVYTNVASYYDWIVKNMKPF